MALFELLEVTLAPDDRGSRMPSPDLREIEDLELPEGATVSLALTFRLAEEVDGLVFEETRRYAGDVIGTQRTTLGGFRAGGPYEIRLPPERLPVGRANCGTYEVEGRFLDAEGRVLGREDHRFRLVHQPAPEPTAG
ncbi:hypothetical protein [Streptomyces sp. NPDC002825]|uniref:hypothetical protein n=1 Tax=Streptomyces sp. NPDC002825 TaxID=3154666 RepID=UPI00331FC3B4